MMEWLDVIKEMSDEAQERMEEEQRSDGSKHPWTKQEDELLKQLIKKYGAKEWSTLAMNVRPPPVLPSVAASSASWTGRSSASPPPCRLLSQPPPQSFFMALLCFMELVAAQVFKELGLAL